MSLTSTQKHELERQHKKCSDKRICDRIKAIILLDKGWSANDIAEALLLSPKSVKRYLETYTEKGLEGLASLNFTGGRHYLTDAQKEVLCKWLDNYLCSQALDACEYVKRVFGITYSVSGMVRLLNSLGYTHKKTKAVPAKADETAQKEWVEKYKEIRENMSVFDKMYFMDGVHPTHNAVVGNAWIRKGKEREIRTNTGRERLNINAAIDIDGFSFSHVYSDSINAQSTIKLFKKIEKANPGAKTIYIVRDNARYYSCNLVKEYLKTSRIVILCLPPYSPNLNLIERLWKFLREKVMRNIYYDNVDAFKKSCDCFFMKFKTKKFKLVLGKKLSENFHIIGQT
jgi:transposase